MLYDMDVKVILLLTQLSILMTTVRCSGMCLYNKDNVNSLPKHPLEMSTIMRHHELRWETSRIDDVILYTVELCLPEYNKSFWSPLFTCQNITTNTCDIDQGGHRMFEHGMDFCLLVTGHINGSNQTIYATETVVFNKITNLTLATPLLTSLKRDHDGMLNVGLKIHEKHHKVLNDENKDLKVKYQIQYWNVGELNRVNISRDAVKEDSTIIFMTTSPWVCVRVRLDAEEVYFRIHTYSPWSETNCTGVPIARETAESVKHLSILIPCLATVCVVFIVMAIVSARKVWSSTCKGFTEKAPLPAAIARIIFDDEVPTETRSDEKPVHYVSEVFQTLDVDIAPPPESPTPISSSEGGRYECYEASDHTAFEDHPTPSSHFKFNMTYGFVCSQDTDNGPADSSYPETAYPYRNLLSSSSTTSTEISSSAVPDRPAFLRFDDAGTEQGSERPEGHSARNNLYFQQNSGAEMQNFEAFNIAYSSNPMRDIPDILHKDGVEFSKNIAN